MIQAADNALKELISESLSVSRRMMDIMQTFLQKIVRRLEAQPSDHEPVPFDIREKRYFRGDERQMIISE